MGTAAISIITAITLWPLIPRALAIPSPKKLREINTKLEAEIAERQLIEEQLRNHKDELENLVVKRTKELEKLNDDLRQAIEELARYAETLQKSEERFGLAIQGSNTGIWDWINVNEEEEWWSPRFYELLGYEDGEIEASLTQFKNLLHPEDTERTFAQVEAHFANKAAFNIEYRLKTKTEGYKWFQGYGALSRDATGNPIRMVGSILDIDWRKRAEETLRDC